jgi:predicted dehydrogenase
LIFKKGVVMENQKIVKLGIVGLGRGLSSIIDVLDLPDLKVFAICDVKTDVLESAKAKLAEYNVFDVECYTDYDEMLMKADINAVSIATDAIYHVPFVVKAMEAGKHVISEIPAVNSLDEAKLLKKTVSEHPNLKYMCGENDCFLGNIIAWKKMYEDGKFGDVVYAEAEYIHTVDYRDIKEPVDKGHWRTFNPAIKYLTHDLGPLLYIMNDRCVSVTCMVPDVIYNPYKDKVAQNAVALFKTAKGAVIRILILFGAYAGYTHNYCIYGTRGMIEFDKSKPRREAHSLAMLSDVPGSFNNKIDIPVTCSSFGDKKDGSHLGLDRKMFKAFVDCVVNDKNPPIDVDLGIRMALPGIFAHESYLNGGSAIDIIDVDDFDKA